MIQQALVNLIGNACLHAGEGAEISVETRMRAEGPVLVVCDNGPGIPDTEHDAVQEPFARLDRSRSTPGSGLGLALVRAIAEHHGAMLVLRDNQPGLCAEIRFSSFNKV